MNLKLINVLLPPYAPTRPFSTMPIEEDWSDSDEDDRSEVETSVLLGVPDGPIDNAADTADAAVSRIGGHPVRIIIPCRMYPCNLIHSQQGISPCEGTRV